MLKHEMSDIRKRMESAQSKIDGLLQEKHELEQVLKKKDVEIEVLKLTMKDKEQHLVTAKEQEAAQYQKQLDFVKQELEAERKKMTPLQEELQRKTAELTKKSIKIGRLKEARDIANSQLKMEKERAELKSKELTAAAISHAIFKTEVKVLHSLIIQTTTFIHFPTLLFTVAVSIAGKEQATKHEDNSGTSENHSSEGV